MKYDTNIQSDYECNECRDLERELASLKKQNMQLKGSLTKIFNHMDNGVIVRDVSKDHEPGWAVAVLHLAMDLKEAKELL